MDDLPIFPADFPKAMLQRPEDATCSDEGRQIAEVRGTLFVLDLDPVDIAEASPSLTMGISIGFTQIHIHTYKNG